MNNTYAESLNKRLEVIIALLLRLLPESKKVTSLKGQIEILSQLGLRPVEIAGILGKSSAHVGKELTLLRKSRDLEVNKDGGR